MRIDYIKQVERTLSVPRKRRREIIRDINEIFDSANEHGETDEEVIDRLGPPELLAQKLGEPLPNQRPSARIRGKWLAVSFVGAIGIGCILAGIAAWLSRPSSDWIGYAEGMTSIQVTGGLGIDIPTLLLVLGGLLVLAALGYLLWHRNRRRRWRK